MARRLHDLDDVARELGIDLTDDVDELAAGYDRLAADRAAGLDDGHAPYRRASTVQASS